MRVAIYTRVSTEEQSQEGLSLGAQEDRCRAFAFAKGWQVVQVYVDAGASGKSLDRPAMQRLIADAQHGVWDVVLAWRLDRLSRRQRDVLYLLEDVLTPHGIGLQSATEPFDTTTPMGKAMLGMLAVFAQLERETIVERTKMGRAQSLKLGRWQGGKVPYGYRHVGRGQLEPNPLTAPVVQRLFAQAATGASPYQLADDLNRRGIPAPGGGLWWDRVVEKLLKNPVYRGAVGRSNPHPGHHAPLVDEITWERVQHKFASRQLGPHADRPDFLVDGLLSCPQCGEPIRGYYARPSNRPATSYDDPVRRYRFYYICAKRRRLGKDACDFRLWHAPKIDAQVVAQIQQWAADPAELDARLAQQFPATAPAYDASLDAQRADIERRVQRWYDAFEQGVIDAATLRARIDQLRQQQAALEAVQPVIPAPALDTALREAIRSFIQNLAGEWARMLPAERQRVVRILIAGGTITPAGQVTLALRPLSQDYLADAGH